MTVSHTPTVPLPADLLRKSPDAARRTPCGCTTWTAEVAHTLRAMPESDQPAMMRQAVEQSGGIWTCQDPMSLGEAMIEISLGGVIGMGATALEAVADWTKAALRRDAEGRA